MPDHPDFTRASGRNAGFDCYHEHSGFLWAATSENHRTRLRTPTGTVLADKVVLATDAWSHHVSPLARRPVPVWTYAGLTEPLTAARLDSMGWRSREGVEDFRDLVHCSRLTPDNRLLMGGRGVGLGGGRRMDHDRHERIARFLGWEDRRSDVDA